MLSWRWALPKRCGPKRRMPRKVRTPSFDSDSCLLHKQWFGPYAAPRSSARFRPERPRQFWRRRTACRSERTERALVAFALPIPLAKHCSLRYARIEESAHWAGCATEPAALRPSSTLRSCRLKLTPGVQARCPRCSPTSSSCGQVPAVSYQQLRVCANESHLFRVREPATRGQAT